MMTSSNKLFVKLLHPDAILPQRKSSGAAGYDVCSIEEIVLCARSKQLVSTGLSFTVPESTYGQLAPRSGLSVKGIHVGAGVIDRDYTGEVKVLLFNMSDDDIVIKPKERIAQLIVKKIELPDVIEVDELSLTERGENGFGSTGNV